MKTRIAVVLLLVAAWVAWPYWSAYRLVEAINEGDVQQLEQRVDWLELRAGLHQNIADELVEATAGESRGIAGALAAIAGPTLIDRMVTALVNPTTLAMLVRQHASSEAAGGRSLGSLPEIDRSKIRYAFFTGPLTFEIDVAAGEGEPELGLVFRFQGSWRLSRLRLPEDEIRRLVEDRLN